MKNILLFRSRFREVNGKDNAVPVHFIKPYKGEWSYMAALSRLHAPDA